MNTSIRNVGGADCEILVSSYATICLAVVATTQLGLVSVDPAPAGLAPLVLGRRREYKNLPQCMALPTTCSGEPKETAALAPLPAQFPP